MANLTDNTHYNAGASDPITGISNATTALAGLAGQIVGNADAQKQRQAELRAQRLALTAQNNMTTSDTLKSLFGFKATQNTNAQSNGIGTWGWVGIGLGVTALIATTIIVIVKTRK